MTDRDDVTLLSEHFAKRTRQTALTAPAVSPDDMADAQRLAQKRGVAPLAVVNDLPHYREQDRLDRVTELAKAQPKVGAFLQDPERAALVKGEEEQLGLFARTLGAWYESPLNAPMRGLRRSELGASIESGATSMLSSLWHTLTDAVDQVAQRPVRTITDAVGLQDGEGNNPFADPLGAQAQADESLAVSREVKADQRASSERVGARPSFDDFVRDPNRAIEQLFAWAGNAGGQSVPQIALAVATRNPAAGGAIMGGTSGAQTFTDLRADGIDRFRAGEAAVQSGLFEAALGRAGLESATAPGARALLTGPLVEAGTEALTAAGQLEVDDLARQRRTPLAQKLSAVLDAGVLGLGFGIGEKGASSVLDVVAGTRPAQRRTAAALTPVLRSLDNAARVTALTEQAAALKLGERSPQTVAAFVDQMGGGEVYLAADQARTLFQSERASADQALGDLLGDPDALGLAEASGGDVVIPMAVYASAIARLPNAAEIAKHVRLHPEDYSAAEMDGGKAEEELAALFGNTDNAAARAMPEDGDAIERIRQDVLGQLQGTNRYSPADAERQANLYAAIFRTLGQRTGMDAGALYDRYALRIRGSRPDILRQRPNNLTAETDALLTAARVGELPSEADAFGPSLIEFLTERGIGAADGMDGEIRRLAESERVGRGGQRRLFRADDPNALGLDRAREAAAEAGYLSADSSLSDFLELLEQDIGGQRVHSTANENRKLADRRNEVLSLQEAMAEAFPDATELEGLSNQDIADRLFGGAVLDQSALEAGPVVAGLTLLAQDDAAFQLPKSKATDLEAIAAELEGEGGITIKREPDLVTFAEEEGATDAYRITTGRGERGVVYESPDAVWIDVSALKQGGGGRRVYSIVANYAFNTGKVFIGDPAGLSDVAQARRLENMLSSALKFGTTRHLYPHAKQREGNATTLVPAIDWREGDDAYNLQQMAAASLTSLEAQFPEIVNLRYDPARDEIRDIAAGAVLDRAAVDRIAGRGREAATAAKSRGSVAPAITGGGRSIERAVLAASLLRGTREEQSAILARLGGQRSARLAGTLYQSPQNPAAGGVSASIDLSPTTGSRTVTIGDTSIDYGVARNGETAEVILVKTPKAKRGAGSARAALAEFLRATDAAGLTVFLTAEPMDKGVSKGKLEAFYKSLGFRKNSGKKADFRARAGMVRDPHTLNQSAPDQTQTPEFRRWFGDSKVVDAGGKPLVVYHGTRANFDTFKQLPGSDMGFHFGTPEQADGRGSTRLMGASNTAVMPVYLAIRNPLRVNDPGYFGVEDATSGDDTFWRQLRDAGVKVLPGSSHRQAIAAIEAAGYDGLVYDNEGEGAGDSWVAFHPEQIKSATANRGTFDPSDPSILFQSGDRGEYVGHHKAPGKSFGATADDLTGGGNMYPDDIYGSRAAQIYGHHGGNHPMDRATIRILHALRGKSDAPVKIYRAVPSDAGDTINPGDWVTVNRDYAKEHGESQFGDDFKIIEQTVKAREIFTNADSIHEWGYDPDGLFQQTAGAPRGQIDIAPDLRMSITLLEGADLSTFLHESGHFFLEVMADLAKDTPALQSDFDAALAWMGIEGETPAERAELWASMTLDERRPMHEQFARGFEAYLAEGKAPSVELASAFGRFKAWMLAVYRSLAQLDVTLTDEVRGVFDRLLATDDEIALVEQRQGMAQPLVEPSEFKTLGLTEAQWADYRNMLDAASEEARAEVFAKLHKAYRREAESWWKEERAKVRAEVADEFEAEPIVRAWRILAGRKIDGLDPALAGLKLDRDSLLDTYAKEYVQTRLKPLGVYAIKGGVSADTAAAMLGLPSGDALVQGLATAKERLARVEAETDARMRERHPDPMTDGSLPDLAERAVHNNARVKALQFELDLLAKLAGQPVPPARAIRRFAQQQIAARQIKGLRANDFLAAERRSARDATKAAAKGDFALALKHKRDQAVQAVLYAEARTALDQVEKHVAYARKFDKSSTRSRIGKAGGDLLEMIDGILGVYAFRPQSDKARDRASTLRQWYDRMLAQGVQPQVDPKVLATIEASRLTHYRELTVGELSAVVELVKQLEHQASEANALRLAGEALELETEAENLSVAIMSGLEHRGPPPISNTLRQSPGEVSKKAARMIAGALLRLRTLAHWVDGAGNVEGAFHRLIVRPLDRAQAAYLDAMGDYGQRVIALFDTHMQGADLTAPIWIPSLNQNLTKADILAAALNTGNASNLQRLKDGMGWGDVQMSDVLRQMGEADWQFVQGVWDTLESLWPQIAEQQKRLTGVDPPKIDALQVQTPWGTLRGGYYPVMYDKDSPQWEGVFGKPDESLFDPMGITALPAQGHTKQRVDQARIPLKLDLAGIPSHLSNVLKDLTHRETLIGMRKLLARPEVVASLHSTLGPEASRFINDKLKHVATDQVYQFAGTMKAVANFSHGLRRHVGVMAMGYSVVTGLKQVLGFSTALEVLTERVGVLKAPRVLAKGYLEVLRGRGASIEAVRALSGEMRHRLDTVDADVRNLYQQYLSGRMSQGAGAKAGRAYDAFRFHAFAIIRYAQGYLVDVPTWVAAHHAAQQKGLAGDAAVAFADDTLIASQGAGGAKDQALIEANIPGIELFTMFYSYANAYFNRQLTLGRDVGKSLQGGPAQFFAELPVLSARFAYLAVVPVILEELIAQAAGQSDGPDDDDDIAAYYGLRMLAYQFYGLPILRDLVPKWAGTQKGAYRISSAQSAMESLSRLVSDVEKTIEGDAPEARKATRDIVMAAGYTFGLPLGGPWKHVDYLWRYFEGEEEPESVPEFAAALAVGKREQQ